MKKINDLAEKIKTWGNDRNINSQSSIKQLDKLLEEVKNIREVEE